jgi:SAM-dependent methyltransferase
MHTMSRAYLMENEEEIQRLERKTDAGVVAEYALRAGLKPGMRVLDLCCGAGLTTSILGELTGDTGSAVGVDFSAPRLDHARRTYGSARISFEQRDVRLPLEGLGTFDFVWVRFALEYFRAESPDIVRHIQDILNPGGIACLIDLDYNCLSHWQMPPRLETAMTVVMDQLESEGNFDPYVGRKLYSFLYTLGFGSIGAHAGAHHLIYGPVNAVDEYNWTRKIEVITQNPALQIPGYESVDEFLQDFLTFFRDPGRFTYTPVIACWGKRTDR